jgi:hypothetical protein
MKNVIVSLIFGFGLLAGNLANAQDTTDLTATNIDWAGAADWQVALQAIEQVPPMPAVDATNGNTFYSAKHALGTSEPWPPLPGEVLDFQVWDLGEGNYLLDDLGYNYQHRHRAQNQSTSDLSLGMTMGADDVPSLPGDGDGSTNDYSPSFSEGLAPDYGTNLYIAQVSQSEGNYSGIMSNTIADIIYEIQYTDELESTNQWQSADWFFTGSEVTNWTPFSVPMTSPTNMFFRIRSWESVDGSGIPLWWEEEYFGTNAVNANVQDSAGDGWTIYQKYEMGVPPATFTTPPTPQEVTSSYDPNTDLVSVNWQPAPGPVTSYTVNIDGTDYSVSAGSTSFQNNISEDDAYYNTSFLGPTYDGEVQVQANYAGGDSPNTTVPLEAMTDDFQDTPGYITSGQGGQAYLTVPALPSGIVSLEITRIDNYAEDYWGDNSFDTNFNISVLSLTNGIVALPAPWSSVCPVDGYGASDYEWWIQTVDAQGNVSSALPVDYGYADNGSLFYNDYSGPSSEWPVEPWFDGREQLKENLIFLLRAGLNDQPFSFTGLYTNGAGQVTYTYPTNYAYASYYEFGNDGVSEVTDVGVFLPFGENYLYDNFVFNLSALTEYGTLPSFDNSATYYSNLGLEEPPAETFNPPTISGTTIAPVLATNGWIYSSLPYTDYGYGAAPTIGVVETENTEDPDVFTNEMVSGYHNTFGLSFLSAEFAWGNSGSDTATLYPGDWTTQSGTAYAGPAEPELETVGYDFWMPPGFPYSNSNLLPGMTGFSPSTPSQLLIAGVGQQNFRVAAYAKMALENGYSGVYGYLGQYFTNAYEINTNGNVTTNQTGILSPYGDFFPTYPGPVALVTMPDPDTGTQATTTVYCVSLALDANHDGNMDLNFGGTDVTSPLKPYVFWCNNNFDRWDNDFPFDTPEQDDQQIAYCPVAPHTPTPDCNYSNVLSDGYAYRAIPCTRDLEDFTRLWVCGMTSNLLAALPSGSTVTLSWGDVGSPNPSNPTIDLFQAADANGGIGYLTNETVAMEQTNVFQNLYIGRLGPGQSLQLNADTFANDWAGNYFVWCGVSNGTGGLRLTIADGSGNVLAQNTAYIQIEDIKNMYERWTVGDNPNLVPTTNAVLSTEGLPDGSSAFQYASPIDTNTPYILLVHGYNLAPWEKDRFAETEYKRLYWQGYQGRFGAFNWPTATHFIEFGASESQSWLSAQGLLNKLTDLNMEYPGHVYLTVHSLGNVAAGEALRLAGTNQVVNTYVAMQAAVSAHTYDPTTPEYTVPPVDDAGAPDCYAYYWTNDAPCYFNTSAGAVSYVNFFNGGDFALSYAWLSFQDLKPSLHPGYLYDDSPSRYYKNFGATELYFPANTYELFSDLIQSRSYALGEEENVGGQFKVGSTYNQVELDAAPYDFGTEHIYHSGEFRSDTPQMWQFWNQVLIQMNLK